MLTEYPPSIIDKHLETYNHYRGKFDYLALWALSCAEREITKLTKKNKWFKKDQAQYERDVALGFYREYNE